MEKLKKIKIVLSIIYFLIVSIFLWSFFTTFSLDEITSYEFIRKNRDFLVGFRESNFVNDMVSSDPSIVGANITYRMMKRFTPNQNIVTSYSIAFNNSISNPHAGHYGAVSSTSFTFQNQTCFLDDDGNGILRIYYLDSQNNKTYLNTSAGTVNYSSGLVVIKSVIITSSSTIEVNAKPAINDISPARNMILLISKASIDIINDSTGVTESSVSNITTAGTTETITSETARILSTGSTGGVTNLVY